MVAHNNRFVGVKVHEKIEVKHYLMLTQQLTLVEPRSNTTINPRNQQLSNTNQFSVILSINLLCLIPVT